MMSAMPLLAPRYLPPLDQDFRPAVLANHSYRAEVEASGQGVPLVIGLERGDGCLSRHESRVFPEGHPLSPANLDYAERLLKFLLWGRSGCTVYVGGARSIGDFIASTYSAAGPRAFDYHFMGQQVYQQPFRVVSCSADQVPAERERAQAIGRHLEGCRIGFDLGASDLKVSAVIDGEPVFSDEIVWEPGSQTDPNYHYQQIVAALRLARSRLPRLDAIGGSSAGVYVDSRPMVASLFRGIPGERFDEIRNVFRRIGREFGVPLVVVNDGEVTALAGAMSLGVSSVLGIALGSSEAAGYIDAAGRITGWLNELAFAPLDYNPGAPRDEWSGDQGVGASYLSQQCVFRLAAAAGIELPPGGGNAERLKHVQRQLAAGHPGARQIWESIGVYLGYAVAHYADFYDLEHVLILGRVTSGIGGSLILNGAREVLAGEFPQLANGIRLQLPDEKSRRVGQSIAAASLPALQ